MPPQEIKDRHPDKTIASYSQVKKFTGCPLQWQLDYGMGLAPPSDTIHTIGGTAFHEAIQSWIRVLYDDGKAAAARLDVEGDFKRRLRAEYVKAQEKHAELDTSLDVPPSTVSSYYVDSLPVIRQLLRRSGEFFDPSETTLHGIETLIEREVRPNVLFIGYLDVVLKYRDSDTYKIVDIKTSTKGWSKFKRQDTKLTNQLAAYKHFFAEDMNVLPGDVSTEFLICQRETNRWQPDHVSSFVPDTGPARREEFLSWLDTFVDTGLDADGSRHTASKLNANPEKFRCVWCPFSKTFDGVHAVCGEGGYEFGEGTYPEGMRPYIDDRWIKD